MGLLDALKNELNEEAETTKRRYVELLSKDSNDPKSIAELRKVAGLLKKSVEQIAADQNAIRTAESWRGVIANGCGLSESIAAADKAVNDHNEHTRQVIDQLKAEHHKLYSAYTDLQGRKSAGENQAGYLRDLAKQFPDVVKLTDADRVTD